MSRDILHRNSGNGTTESVVLNSTESVFKRYPRLIRGLGLVTAAAAGVAALGFGVDTGYNKIFHSRKISPMAVQMVLPHCVGHNPQLLDVTAATDFTMQISPKAGSDQKVTVIIDKEGKLSYPPHQDAARLPAYSGQPEGSDNFVFSDSQRFNISELPAGDNRSTIHIVQDC